MGFLLREWFGKHWHSISFLSKLTRQNQSPIDFAPRYFKNHLALSPKHNLGTLILVLVLISSGPALLYIMHPRSFLSTISTLLMSGCAVATSQNYTQTPTGFPPVRTRASLARDRPGLHFRFKPLRVLVRCTYSSRPRKQYSLPHTTQLRLSH